MGTFENTFSKKTEKRLSNMRRQLAGPGSSTSNWKATTDPGKAAAAGTGGTWNVATPNGATGTGILQYDGVDGSFNRNEQGLGNLDLTLDQANGFRFLIFSDLPTDYTFRVYTSTGLGTAELSVPGGANVFNEYTILFSQFSGAANFAQVGAIEIEVQLLPNVDSLISSFTTIGPAIATSSPNPSQAPAASRSPDAEIDWYTFDDDDNGRSPCGDEPDRKTYFLQDDNIIYYYFYGLPDPVVYYEESAASLITLSALVGLVFVALF